VNIVVIGGGISGLACAWFLKQRGQSVILLERGERFGGVIDTVQKDGFLFDVGPQSFLSTPLVSRIIDDLGLSDELLKADPKAPRYILLAGQLLRAPTGPLELLRTPLISTSTKLRLFTEVFRHTHPPSENGDDESVAAFVRRKFGSDLLANVVAPFVSGVYAGDPERLSLVSAFPAVRRLEERHGSIVRGAIRSRRRSGGKRPSLCNFKMGVRTLTDGFAAELREHAVCNAEVVEIRPRKSAADAENGFEVIIREAGVQRALRAGAVVVAAPTSQAASLLAHIEPAFAVSLMKIEYASVAQVSAGYDESQISWRYPASTGGQSGRRGNSQPSADAERLRGFGFLVPRSAGLRLLGSVWNSSLFQNRAPQINTRKAVSFTSFVGGATDPEMCKLSEQEIASTVHSELATVLGIDGSPVVQHVVRWMRALPQYNIGHSHIVRDLNDLCARNRGVFLTGNYLGGPSLGSCVTQAAEVADAVATFCT
jgi:oxygen-dependent protoporphyrinogen oxidase